MDEGTVRFGLTKTDGTREIIEVEAKQAAEMERRGVCYTCGREPKRYGSKYGEKCANKYRRQREGRTESDN